MSVRALPLLCLFLFSEIPLAQESAQARPVVPETCPITKRESQPMVPPPPYTATAPDGAFWYGTDRLWTILGESGSWLGLRHYEPSDPTFRQKLFYWRQGYDWEKEPKPPLTITGKRLDAQAPPLMVDPPGGGYREEDWKSFMITGINLPTLGCWEITARYQEDDLSFVVWVAEPDSKSAQRAQPDRDALLAKARHGDPHAQMWLGAGYKQGWFGKPDYQEAYRWLKKAAARDDPDAQLSLGQMYEDGEGVQQDYTQAAYWYRISAEHVPDLGGAGQGRNRLGMLYMDGLGVPKDYVQAYMWFTLSFDGANLRQARSQMTPDQIAEAEQMVAAWKARHPE